MASNSLVRVVLTGLVLWTANTAGAAKPNILFLMTDQHRGDCLGADGNAIIRTPNLDRLAAEGARFRHAYSSIPSCVPARTAILTGLAPWRHGMLAMRTMAVQYEREMPALLREAGYYTMGIGKMHFHPQRALRGFHRIILDESGRQVTPDFRSDYRAWFWSMAPTLDPDATGIGWNDFRSAVYALPEELHPTRWTADAAVNFLEAYSQDEPFFLKVSFARPHSPYDPPERFMRLYENADAPPAAIGDWAERNNVKPDPKDFTIWRGNVGPDIVRRSRRAYYGSISFIDEQIGRILRALEARGLLDNTLILFTSDHGDMLGDHYLWRKTYAYEGSARVPMLVRWPKSLDAPRGQVLTAPVEMRDILPTFLDAAGVQFNKADFDGASMLEPIRGRTQEWRGWIDLEHGQQYADAGYWTALTDGRFKYVFYGSDGREQLFDLANDPHELRELSADPRHAQTLHAWRERMVRHLQERGEPFVKDDQLVGPRPNVTFSPNFPQQAQGNDAGSRRRS